MHLLAVVEISDAGLFPVKYSPRAPTHVPLKSEARWFCWWNIQSIRGGLRVAPITKGILRLHYKSTVAPMLVKKHFESPRGA